MNLGKVLKTARLNQGISVTHAANQLHVSTLKIIVWEADIDLPNDSQLQRMAWLYDFNADTARQATPHSVQWTPVQQGIRLIVLIIGLLLLSLHLTPVLIYASIAVMIGLLLVNLIVTSQAAYSTGRIGLTLVALALILLLTPTFLRAPSVGSWSLVVVIICIVVAVKLRNIRLNRG